VAHKAAGFFWGTCTNILIIIWRAPRSDTLARVGWLLSVVEVLFAPVLRSDALARTSAAIPHANFEGN
jgi:hypothetical protein